MNSCCFTNRMDAGQQLAHRLSTYAGRDDVIVLALPRGGVPVGHTVAQALHAPLDILLVRKLGAPGYEEFAMGAIASGDVIVLQKGIAAMLGVGDEALRRVVQRELAELKRRETLYRDSRPKPQLKGKTVILVDDGLATGSTMRAAVKAVRKENPARVVVAVPVAAPDTCAGMESEVDEIVCAETPEPFRAVGQWYDDFTQITDDEVIRLLRQATQRHAPDRDGSGAGSPP
ncbi:MAG: phosphoribosyltransferase [Herminiimonas sp.]|jgi:putative phosphoribosyl transferase|nr:phosphoribosyltransferase [Herminiimonas sp.]